MARGRRKPKSRRESSIGGPPADEGTDVDVGTVDVFQSSPEAPPTFAGPSGSISNRSESDRSGSVGSPSPTKISSDEILHRSKLVELFCSIYALTMSSSGMVLPLTVTITRHKFGMQHYHEEFELYMFTGSICFMLFIFGKHLRQFTRRSLASKGSKSSTGDARPYNPSPSGWTPRNMTANNQLGVAMPVVHRVVPIDENNFDSNIEGVTAYVTAGALLFGLGSMTFSVVRLADYAIREGGHLNRLLPTLSVTQFIYVLLQTFFIFRYHRAVIRENQAFVKCGFSHLIATNLFTWLSTLVHETEEDHARSALGLNLTKKVDGHAAGGGDAGHLVADASGGGGHGGEHERRLLHDLAPYLTPCMIEYSLISAVVMYSIYCNIGRQSHSANLKKQKSGIALRESLSSETRVNIKKYKEDSLCPQTDRGALACALPLVATIIAVIAAVINQGSELSDTIYSLTQQILLAVSSIATIAGLKTMQQINVCDTHHGFLDLLLLVVTMSGNYAYQTFVFLAAVNGLSTDHIWALPLAKSVMSLFQSTLQTAFILDGLRRRVQNEHLATLKPGRFIIMFILVCNISIWIVMTFGVTSHGTSKLTTFYGREAWVIIAHVFSPMTIFYRFHSSVCLADIWLQAYEMKEEED